MAAPGNYAKLLHSLQIPLKPYDLLTIVLNKEGNFLFLVVDAIAEIDGVLRILGQPLKGNVVIKGLPDDLDGGVFIRI